MNLGKLILVAMAMSIMSCSHDDSKLSSPIQTQYPEYYRLYNQAVQLEKHNKVREAYDIFLEAEKLVDYIPLEHLLKARSWALMTSDCKRVLQYFQKAVEQGHDAGQMEFSYSVCPDITNNSVHAAPIDSLYQNQIVSMYEADQEARRSGDKAAMRRVDSLNIVKLLQLIREKGFPASHIVGEKAASNAFILLLHCDSDIGNVKLKPILDKAYNSGWLSPREWAWIIDRRRHWGPDQLDPYYYQLPTEYYFEMTDQEKAVIDSRRDSIGLRPLDEMGIKRLEGGGISISNY